jgi:hypothetical protein
MNENIEARIDGFGRSTQKQFDTALASLPALIAEARRGDTDAGAEANSLLWALANEANNSRCVLGLKIYYPFGK